MDEFDYIANCRIIFYNAIGMYTDTTVVPNHILEQDIITYSYNNFERNFEMIEALNILDDEPSEAEWINICKWIVKYNEKVSTNTPKAIIEIYDSVGEEMVEKLTNFAMEVCDYMKYNYENGSWVFKQ